MFEHCCKFCGQVVLIEEKCENEREALEMATMMCNCPDAQIYQALTRYVEEAKLKVDEIIKNVDTNHNIIGLSNKSVEQFKNNLDLFLKQKLKSISFVFDKGIGTISATLGESGIRIVRELKIKENV